MSILLLKELSGINKILSPKFPHRGAGGFT